jgi:hypothetical protein
MLKTLSLTFTAAVLAVMAGCSQSSNVGDGGGGAAVDGSKYLLSSEPEGAQHIIAARKSTKDKDDVVLIGRIGGSKTPWVKDMAAFTIVDSSLKSCADRPDDNCPAPWDYCCETNTTLADSSVVVHVVDGSGNIVKQDASKLLNVKELATVVVRGKAKRDANGNFTILATGVYVKQ